MAKLTGISLLSGRIKITSDSEGVEALSEMQIGFYVKYASFVLRTLKNPSFQRFLRWMLKSEKIEEEEVRDVQIRVFPLRRNGNGLAGNCNTSKGKITICPKTLGFCKTVTQEFGKDKFISYAGSRARASLIHELLHLKYMKNEEKVRLLTEEYFASFARSRSLQNLQEPNIYDIIFNKKSIQECVETERNA